MPVEEGDPDAGEVQSEQKNGYARNDRQNEARNADDHAESARRQ